MADKVKVAIIEDDIALVQMYRTKFEIEGYEVDTAGDGNVGKELIKQFNPDVILLDIMMPDKNGLDMLRELKAVGRMPKGKIIVLTNIGQDTTVKEARELGAIDYIVKAEMTPTQVSEKVKQILTKK
jgi:DNA-binding response OmpR family regulator